MKILFVVARRYYIILLKDKFSVRTSYAETDVAESVEMDNIFIKGSDRT